MGGSGVLRGSGYFLESGPPRAGKTEYEVRLFYNSLNSSLPLSAPTLIVSDGRRAMIALDQIIAFVSVFPTTNDSSLANSTTPSDLDIPALLSSIRSKYRAACASLGIRPRMVAAPPVKDGDEEIRAVSMSI